MTGMTGGRGGASAGSDSWLRSGSSAPGCNDQRWNRMFVAWASVDSEISPTNQQVNPQLCALKVPLYRLNSAGGEKSLVRDRCPTSDLYASLSVTLSCFWLHML